MSSVMRPARTLCDKPVDSFHPVERRRAPILSLPPELLAAVRLALSRALSPLTLPHSFCKRHSTFIVTSTKGGLDVRLTACLR